MDLPGVVPTLRMLLERLGVEGVSAVTVLVLLSVYAYFRKASRWGAKAVYRAGKAGEYGRAAALILLVLLLAGVIHADPARARELLEAGHRTLQGVLPWPS